MFPTPPHQHISSTIPSHNQQGDSNTAASSSSSEILLGVVTEDTTLFNDKMEALLLDTSFHTILPLPDDDEHEYYEDSSIEQQLSALEQESNNFFETLEKKDFPLPKEQEQGSDLHDASSTTVSYDKAGQDTSTLLHYEEYCDISLGTKESTISSKSEGKRMQSFGFSTDHDILSETEEGSTLQEKGFSKKLFPTNLSSDVFHCNEKTSTLDSVLLHSFVKEYEIRAKELRTCMNRTKSSRSKVAKVKQYLTKRYLQKNSSRSKKLGTIEAISGMTKMSDGQLSSCQDLFTLLPM